jgi:hypothetical protein
MLMVLLEIIVSQSMSLLIGCVVDASERLVESKLLEGLRFGAASWCDGKAELLLECDSLDCGMFMEDGRGFGLEGWGGAGLGSGVEEARRAPPADFPYRVRSSLTRRVAR